MPARGIVLGSLTAWIVEGICQICCTATRRKRIPGDDCERALYPEGAITGGSNTAMGSAPGNALATYTRARMCCRL